MTSLMSALIAGAVGLMSVSVFIAFASPFAVRLIVLLYPPDSPRRDEFISELGFVPIAKRPTFLAGVLATAIAEAVPDRLQFAVRDFNVTRRLVASRRPARWSFKYVQEWDVLSGFGFALVLASGLLGGNLVVGVIGVVFILSPMIAPAAEGLVNLIRWAFQLLRSLRHLRSDRARLVRDLLGTIDE